MANIRIMGDSAVITSSKTFDDICTLCECNPKALRLFEDNEDGKKEEVFRVDVGIKGSMNQHGAVFAGESRDGQGNATITVCIPSDVGDVKEWAYDRFGVGMMRLNEVEKKIDAAIEKVKADKAAVMESIQVV